MQWNFLTGLEGVVTFNAPGVSPEQAEQFNKLKNKPSVTSHIAEGDVVDTAGRGQLQGDIYKHYLPEDDLTTKIGKYNLVTFLPVIAMDTMSGTTVHFDYLLSSQMYSKQQKELLPKGWNMQDMINAVKNPKDKNKVSPFKSIQNPTFHKEYPHTYKSAMAEFWKKDPGCTLKNTNRFSL